MTSKRFWSCAGVILLAFASATSPSQARADSYVYVAQWGSLGSGDGQFYYPEYMALDDSGNVYAGDGGFKTGSSQNPVNAGAQS